MTEQFYKGYSKGYNTGRANHWPMHRPIEGDHELILSAVKLRDAARDVCSVFMPDEEFTLKLQEKIDEFDRCLIRHNKTMLSAK